MAGRGASGGQGSAGARRKRRPAGVVAQNYLPQLATLVASAPGAGFIHELKYDGYRIGCLLADGQVQLISRNGKDWTGAFPGLTAALRTLDVGRAVLDGEVVALLPDGLSSFQALQNALNGASQANLQYVVFDLLERDGEDLRARPLLERKRILAELLSESPRGVKYAEHVETSGAVMLEAACKLGAEGIVSKRATAPYRAGRNTDWQKVKCVLRQELVVGGFTEPAGSRVGVGALLLGHHERGKLVFAGKVGTGKGLTGASLRKLRAELEPLVSASSPFSPVPSRALVGAQVQWVKPELVAEVAFAEWTDDGRIRHASLQGTRRDKRGSEVKRERPVRTAAGAHTAKPKSHGTKRAS